MLCFFCMGFVDLVGIASNYVKEDLGLTDSVANIFPSLVFFWFLIFSVPTGMLMNKIGRKNTVLLSLIVTVVSLFIPLLGSSFTVMLIAFSLLGIGPGIHPDFRSVCESHRLVPRSLLGHVGRHSCYAYVRIRLARVVPCLFHCRHPGYGTAVGYSYSGRYTGG